MLGMSLSMDVPYKDKECAEQARGLGVTSHAKGASLDMLWNKVHIKCNNKWWSDEINPFSHFAKFIRKLKYLF